MHIYWRVLKHEVTKKKGGWLVGNISHSFFLTQPQVHTIYISLHVFFLQHAIYFHFMLLIILRLVATQLLTSSIRGEVVKTTSAESTSSSLLSSSIIVRKRNSTGALGGREIEGPRTTL